MNTQQINVGDMVYNKHRVGFSHAYSIYSKPVYGEVKSIEHGCNGTIYDVDFGLGFLSPLIDRDIEKKVD
jgi:hypothetical protein